MYWCVSGLNDMQSIAHTATHATVYDVYVLDNMADIMLSMTAGSDAICTLHIGNSAKLNIYSHSRLPILFLFTFQ